MTNGIAQVVIGIALAAATGGVAALNPGYKPHEDVAYLERVATTVERAKVLAPENPRAVVQAHESIRDPAVRRPARPQTTKSAGADQDGHAAFHGLSNNPNSSLCDRQHIGQHDRRLSHDRS